jgi:hypothetical protein
MNMSRSTDESTDESEDRPTDIVPFRPALSDHTLTKMYEAVVQPTMDPITVTFKIVYLREEETAADLAAAQIKHPAAYTEPG